jgi:membrane-associated protease RseP (regulator of RpoE activity)
MSAVATVAAPIAFPQATNMAMVVEPGMSAGGGAMAALESPLPNFVPRKLKVFEGHWQGMDGRLMTEELARKLNYPRGVQGVLLGEVTLNAAFSGLLGGDVIVRIDDTPVSNMEDFQAATRNVANRSEARISVIRKDNRPGAPVLRKLTIVLRAAEGGLGFAQLEGAPMILPGDPRPHGYRGACTDCHPVGQGFELAPDPDLISLPPPAITRNAVTRGVSPHEVRGPCEACHVIN